MSLSIHRVRYTEPKDCDICFDLKNDFVQHEHPENEDRKIHDICTECFDRLERNNCPVCNTGYREEVDVPEVRILIEPEVRPEAVRRSRCTEAGMLLGCLAGTITTITVPIIVIAVLYGRAAFD